MPGPPEPSAAYEPNSYGLLHPERSLAYQAGQVPDSPVQQLSSVLELTSLFPECYSIRSR